MNACTMNELDRREQTFPELVLSIDKHCVGRMWFGVRDGNMNCGVVSVRDSELWHLVVCIEGWYTQRNMIEKARLKLTFVYLSKGFVLRCSALDTNQSRFRRIESVRQTNKTRISSVPFRFIDLKLSADRRGDIPGIRA